MIIQFDDDVFSSWKSQFYFIDDDDRRFLFVQFHKKVFIRRHMFHRIWIDNPVFLNIFCFHWNVSDVFECHCHSRWFSVWIIVLCGVYSFCGISICRHIAVGFELFFNSFFVFINVQSLMTFVFMMIFFIAIKIFIVEFFFFISFIADYFIDYFDDKCDNDVFVSIVQFNCFKFFQNKYKNEIFCFFQLLFN